MNEEKARLKAIAELIDRVISSNEPLLVSTMRTLLSIKAIALATEGSAPPIPEITPITPPDVDHIIISCDASIKRNPGGPAAVGIVIQRPGVKTIRFAQGTPSTTNNQAEYDAIYTGLTTLVDLVNSPQYEIEVRSDSKLVIQQLTKEIECNDSKLKNKRDMILELVAQIPALVRFEWRPRNSTPELETANFLCQDALGVPRH